MSTVLIERVRNLNGKEKPPVFAEVGKTFEKIQQRAFSYFEERGELPGLDWDDWLLAEHEVLGSASAELLESDKEWKLRVDATIDSHWSNRIVPGGESRMSFEAKTPDLLWIG